MKRTLLGAIAAAATVLFADLAGLNLAWSNWFDAGIASLSEGGALTSEWTAPSAADDCAVVTKDGASVIEIDTDEELVYTPATSPSSPIVRCDISVYPALHGGFPSEVPADGVQTMLVPYTNDGVVAWAACVKVSGETNWVSLTGVTPNPNALTDVRIEFDYRSTPKVSFLVKSNGDYVALQDGGANTWFDTLSDKTSVSSFAFTGEGAVASLAGANGAIVVDVAQYNGTGYTTVEAAVSAAVADGWANGNVTLLDDATWSPSAKGTYQIDVNGHDLAVTGAPYTNNGTAYTVTGLAYYWIGGASGAWDNGANWSHAPGGAAAGTYPNSGVNKNNVYAEDTVFFTNDATVTATGDRYAVSMTAVGATVTLTGGGSIKTAYNNNSGKFQLLGTGTFCMNGIRFVLPYNTKAAESATIATPIFVMGTSNVIYLATGISGRNSKLTLSSTIGGTGDLEFSTATISQTTLSLAGGDFSDFSGTVTINARATTLGVDGGGTYVIGTNAVVSSLSTITFRGEGGTLAFADGVTGDVSGAITGSTAPMTIDTGAENFVWDTALPASNVGGLVKKGPGTLILAEVPLYGGMTTVEEGILVVPGGTTVANLAVEDGAKLGIGGEDGETVTITAVESGTDLETAVVASPGLTLSWSGTVATIVRTPMTFTWTGARGTDWFDAGNWNVNGSTSYVVPAECDTVLFPASDVEGFLGWTVALSSVATVTNVTANGDVTISGALIYTETVEGVATITLEDDAGFGTYRYTGAQLAISANLKAIGSAANKNRLYGYYTTKSGNPDQGGTKINFSGNLTGDGYLQIIGCRATDTMSGDWSEFAGTVELWNDKVKRHTVSLASSCLGSSNAVWIAYTSDQNPLAQGNKTTYFGALNGMVYQPKNNYNGTWEIGALNQDCEFGGKMGATEYNHIRKVGTATLTFTGSHLGNLEVRDGVFAAGTETAIPNGNITFTGNGVFDPTTNRVDFAAKLVNSTAAPIGLFITNDLTVGEIPASNTAGLTKKGAGTLTLSEIPLYTGITTVEAGSLVVPAGTEVTLNALYASNVPANATVVGYGYAAGTELTWTAEAPSYDKPLNVAGLKKVDLTGATIANGLVVVTAADITGLDWQNVELVLPEGAKQNYWRLRVAGAAGGGKALVLLPIRMPTVFTLR